MWSRLLAIVLSAGIAVLAFGYREARSDPVVRSVTIPSRDWPAGASPVTVALVSDIHMESAAMDAGRLDRIVGIVNARRPDLIVLAGDFVEGRGRDEAMQAIPQLAAGLAKLSAPLGVVAVLGNHDYWTDPPAVAAMLRRAGITVLRNTAVARGPLRIGGLDDEPTGHDRPNATVRAMAALRGVPVLIAHSPEIARRLPPSVPVVLAGHTHCNQIVLPFWGAIVNVSDPHYRCGVIRDPGRTTIVTAGVGTSEVPLRYGAHPDIWLVRFEPARISRPRS